MKYTKIQMTGHALISLLSNPERLYQVTENPLPKDSRLIDIVRDSLRNCYWLVVESDEYPEIPEGVMPVDATPPVIKSRDARGTGMKINYRQIQELANDHRYTILDFLCKMERLGLCTSELVQRDDGNGCDRVWS